MPPRSTKADKAVVVGFLQALAGCIMFVLLGAVALISRVWSLLMSSPGTLSLVLLLIGIAGGIFFLWLGIRNFIIASYFGKISRIMGESTHIRLSELEQKLNRSGEQLTRYLRHQIARGFWADAYLDTEGGMFILGYSPPGLLGDTGDLAVDELLKTANSFLHEMKTICPVIADQDMKAQGERLVEIAEKIYAFVKENPGKVRQVRQFSNYYLPTTAGLLKNYHELEGLPVKGENILESLSKITGIMSNVEKAFEKQFDDLYYDKSLDIYVDIEVMQKMIDS